MQTIVLRFDYRSSTKIEKLQQQVKAGSLKKSPSLPPHLTLHSFDQANPEELERAIRPIAEQTTQWKLDFASIGFFKQKGTLFLSPIQTKMLNSVHQSIQLAAQEYMDSASLYRTDKWVPHTTIVNNVSPQFFGPMFSRLAMEFEPFSASVSAIECWSIENGKTDNDWSFFFN